MTRTPLTLTLALTLLAAGAAAQTVRKVPQDFPTIQAAVDASANNDQIVIAGGTYHESVLVTGKSFLNFTGMGSVVIAPASGAGLTLDTCDHFFIQGLKVKGATTYGFHLIDTSGCVLFKCGVDTTGLDGLRIDGGGQNTLEKVLVKHAGADGIALATGLPDFTDNNLIVVCKVIGAVTDGISFNGSNNHVDTCTVTGAVRDGFSIDDTTAGASNTFKDSKVVKAGRHGLLSRGDTPHVTGCKFIAPATMGVNVQTGTGGFITDSKLVKCGASGLSVLGDGFHLVDNTISKPVDTGVLMLGNNAVVQGCKVTGAGNDGFAIEANDGSYTGNTATKAKSDGFLLEGTGNTLSGNSAKGSKGFDLDSPVPANNTVDGTNNFPKVGP